MDSDRPAWLLSSYGPAKYEPNLVSGIDESFEELHLKATLALASNSVQDYVRLRVSLEPAQRTHKVYRSNMKQKRLRPLNRSTATLETTSSKLMTKPRRTRTLHKLILLQLPVPLAQQLNPHLAPRTPLLLRSARLAPDPRSEVLVPARLDPIRGHRRSVSLLHSELSTILMPDLRLVEALVLLLVNQVHSVNLQQLPHQHLVKPSLQQPPHRHSVNHRRQQPPPSVNLHQQPRRLEILPQWHRHSVNHL